MVIAVRECSPRVHVASAAGVPGRGTEVKKTKEGWRTPLSFSLLRIATLEKEESGSEETRGEDCKVDIARLQNRSLPVFRQQPVLLTIAFVHFVLLIASGILNVYPSVYSPLFSHVAIYRAKTSAKIS